MQPALLALVGWLRVALDTLVQRVLNRNAAAGHVELSAAPSALLSGRTAVVTGANTGLGLETARQLARAGASVVLACRTTSKGDAARAGILADVPGADVRVAPLDLSDLTSVRAFAAALRGPLHVLVLNAGVMCVPRAAPETHFAVNHVAHAALALLLLPALRAGAREGHARVVVVSSITVLLAQLDLDDVGFVRRRYRSFVAYANSKLCNVLFARALAARLYASGVSVRVVHPGEATTDVARNLGSVLMNLHKRVGALYLLSPAEAARTSVHAAVVDVPGAGAPRAEGHSPLDMMHAVSRTLRVPDRLVDVGAVEKLWHMTMAAAGMTAGELAAARDAGLRDEPAYEECGRPVVEPRGGGKAVG